MAKLSAELLKKKFLKRIRKTEKGCWEWTGALFNTGYGQVRRNGTLVGAHRVSWEMKHGKIPDGLNVLHKCDNRPCVNPSHLFLGTDKDNSQDMLRKGRGNKASGEKHGGAKMNWAKVKELRERFGGGESGASLGRRFGIDITTALDIAHFRIWKVCPATNGSKAVS